MNKQIKPHTVLTLRNPNKKFIRSSNQKTRKARFLVDRKSPTKGIVVRSIYDDDTVSQNEFPILDFEADHLFFIGQPEEKFTKQIKPASSRRSRSKNSRNKSVPQLILENLSPYKQGSRITLRRTPLSRRSRSAIRVGGTRRP